MEGSRAIMVTSFATMIHAPDGRIRRDHGRVFLWEQAMDGEIAISWLRLERSLRTDHDAGTHDTRTQGYY
jgi:hypothetical protein